MWLFIGPKVSHTLMKIKMMVRMGWLLSMPWKKDIESWCKGKDSSCLHQTFSSVLAIDNVTRLDRQAYNKYGALNLFLPAITLLPEEMHSLSTLQRLIIWDCSCLAILPDWIGNLTLFTLITARTMLSIRTLETFRVYII